MARSSETAGCSGQVFQQIIRPFGGNAVSLKHIPFVSVGAACGSSVRSVAVACGRQEYVQRVAMVSVAAYSQYELVTTYQHVEHLCCFCNIGRFPMLFDPGETCCRVDN